MTESDGLPIDSTSTEARHGDVMIVGAGFYGIGAASQLTQQCPGNGHDEVRTTHLGRIT